jgi:hypothetical protein
MMEEECVKDCELMEFKCNLFFCNFYDSNLKYKIEDDKLKIFKCKKCMEEGIIGINKENAVREKMKKHLGWLADSFYSFKDEFEDELTEIHRLLRSIEDESR